MVETILDAVHGPRLDYTQPRGAGAGSYSRNTLADAWAQHCNEAVGELDFVTHPRYEIAIYLHQWLGSRASLKAYLGSYA